MEMTLDEKIEMLNEKYNALVAAIEKCDEIQAAGRTGYEAYIYAKSLYEDYTQFSQKVVPHIQIAIDKI